jgi:hypothetical protein
MAYYSTLTKEEMLMPARRHVFSNCSHRGFGGLCHRCAEADKLDALANKAPNKDEAKKLADEALRLRAPAKPKGQRITQPEKVGAE